LWPLHFHSFAQSQHFTPGIIPQEEKWADWNTWLKPYTHWLRLSVCLSTIHFLSAHKLTKCLENRENKNNSCKTYCYVPWVPL
jgi:hypothetical protein